MYVWQIPVHINGLTLSLRTAMTISCTLVYYLYIENYPSLIRTLVNYHFSSDYSYSNCLLNLTTAVLLCHTCTRLRFCFVICPPSLITFQLGHCSLRLFFILYMKTHYDSPQRLSSKADLYLLLIKIEPYI